MRFICGAEFMTPLLIIKDWKYYIEHGEEIEAWANACTPGWTLTGMILNFKTEQDRLVFLLRWN